MSRRHAAVVVLACLLLSSCAPRVEQHTVSPIPSQTGSPLIVGDGMEVRCYRVTAGRQELRRALLGLGATLRSSNTLVLRGLEYYELDIDRLDDLVTVICNRSPWNIRWLGQSFTWLNMLPAKVPVDVDGDRDAWVALPGRTWSTMMEDGPVVYLEVMPMVGFKRVPGEPSGRFDTIREEDLRAEYVLRPGTCIILVGGRGVPLLEVDAVDAGDKLISTETLGAMLTRSTDPDSAAYSGMGPDRDLLVFLPHFTSERLRSLEPRSAPGSP